MRKRWFALVGMVLILAWGRAMAQDVSFGPSIRVDDDTTGLSQFSPALAVDRDGNIYIAWEDTRNFSITGKYDIYFSSSFDGGRSWTRNVQVNTGRTPYPDLPDIALDAKGNIYLVWDDETVGNVYFSMSTDSGRSWTPEVRVNEDAPGMAVNPALAVDDSGNIYVSWSDSRQDLSDIYFTRSTDAGRSWLVPNRRVNLQWDDVQLKSSISVDTRGNLYVVWLDYIEGEWDLYSSRSIDGGLTWGFSAKVNNDDMQGHAGDATIDVDSEGNLLVAWKHSWSYGEGVYFSRSTDAGSTWTPSVKVNNDTLDRYARPSLALDNRGNIYVAWDAQLSSDSTPYHVYLAVSTDSGKTWSDSSIRVDDSLMHDAYRPTIDIGESLGVYVAWDGARYSEFPGGTNIYFAADTIFSGIEDWIDNPAVIRDFRLYQNYPNPFNSTTVVSYRLSAISGQESAISDQRSAISHQTSAVGRPLSAVCLSIHNILGQRVKTLVNEEQYPGYYEVIWDGKNDQGKDLASGVYFCRLECGDFIAARKLILLR